ncbi:MAG: hypothetical protein WCL57_01855 [Chloroflexota bacterium]
MQVVLFGVDGPGTATPAGHWNKIAVDLMAEAKVTDPLWVI